MEEGDEEDEEKKRGKVLEERGKILLDLKGRKQAEFMR